MGIRTVYFAAVAKEGPIVTEGTVTQVLPGTMFRVDLPGQRNVLAHISGKMRKHFIRIVPGRSEEHTSELQSPYDLVCRLLLEKKKTTDKAPASTGAPARCSTISSAIEVGADSNPHN